MGKSFWVVVVGVAVVMVGVFVLLRDEASAPTQFDGDPMAITAEDKVQGPDDAPVTLVKYSDFQCPACGSAFLSLEDIKPDFEGELRFVYRHFLVTQPHVRTFDAARASVAAGEQDSFWEMHDLLFERQPEWTQDPNAREAFFAYAEELGLDMERFEADFEAADERVERDRSIASELGLASTPTFFLNGELVEDLQHFGELRDRIQAALDAE